MPKAPRLPVDGSWVLEGDDNGTTSGPGDEDMGTWRSLPTSSLPRKPKTRDLERSRTNDGLPRNEFIMPSISVDSVEDSLPEARQTRMGTSPAQARRRPPRQYHSKGTLEENEKPMSKVSARDREHTTSQRLQDILGDKASSLVNWLLDIFTGAIGLLRTPIQVIVALGMLFGILILTRNLVTSTAVKALQPVCYMPGVKMLDLPFCTYSASAGHATAPVEFDQLINIQSKFEEVLEESAVANSLPLVMKRAESSVRDLRQLVKYSQLQSKDELVHEFSGFLETARIASYDLQKFNSHVGRAVDSVISSTRWTVRVLDGIEESLLKRGVVSAWINDRLVAPFVSSHLTENHVLDQYIKHARYVEDEIHQLVAEAQALLLVLHNLDDRLYLIADITARDDQHVKAAKDQVLALLWSKVGGNKNKLAKMNRELDLLKHVDQYRSTACAHVQGTVLKLQEIRAALEDLRERVGAPESLRDVTTIPLSVHIETILQGVDRLQEKRADTRKEEDSMLRKILDRQTEGATIGWNGEQ